MALALTPVQRIVMEALAAVTERPVDELGLDADIFDLGLDSLELLTILMDVEERAGAEVPSEVFDALAQTDSRLTVARILDMTAAWNPGHTAGA